MRKGQGTITDENPILKALFTTVSVMATLFAVVAQGRHTSILTPEQRATIPESELYVADYHGEIIKLLKVSETNQMGHSYIWEYGSKNFLVGMSTYTAVVWTLKVNSRSRCALLQNYPIVCWEK